MLFFKSFYKLLKVLIIYLLLIFVCIFMIGPFLWMLSTALKTSGNVYTWPPQLIPKPPSLQNFIEIWKLVPLSRWTLNSAYVAILGTFLNIIVNTLAAYPLARLNFPGKNLIMILLVTFYMLPHTANFIVNYLTLKSLHLTNTLNGVFITGIANIFGIFMIRQAYLAIPKELEESARLDGASEFTIWRKIMLPLVLPSIATLGIFTFVGYWNEFFWPLIVINKYEKYTLALGLKYLDSQFVANTRYVMAGGVFSIIPIIIIFLFAQRYYITGLTSGAIK